MQGIFTLLCIETENQYMAYSDHVEDALEEAVTQLNQGSFFHHDLQEEWTKYGEDAFERGIPAEMGEDLSPEEKEEAIEEWMNILNDVTYLGEYN